MTGAEPNQDTTDRKRGISTVSGTFGTETLTLVLAPDRVDWFLTASSEFPDLPFAVEDIGPMRDTLDEFSALAESWLGADDLPNAARIAFGLVLHHREADTADAYKRLPDYVPIGVELGWKDFFFQVNIPSPLAREEYGIEYLNRLSKWSVTALRTGMVTVGGQGIISAATPPPRYSLRLELDISTPADSLEPLSRPKLVPIYRELVSAGQAIARNGVVNEQYRLK